MVRVLVIGASGWIGKSTLGALVSRHPELQIFAGVRDPSKFAPMPHVTAVHADMGNEDELATILQDYPRIFIVTPGTIDRRELATHALNAAKKSGSVEFALLLSVSTAETDSIFGRQFGPLEAHAKSLDIPLTIVRVPIFMDNLVMDAATIRDRGTFYDARDPTKVHTPVVVADIAKSNADILANPAKFIGHTYNLVSPPFTLNDLGAALTKALGKPVHPTTVPYEAAKQALMKVGVQEWLADGLVELFQFINQEHPSTNVPSIDDIEFITGEKATTIEEWVEQNAHAFK